MPSVLAPQRLLPDPVHPHRPGMLSREDLVAVKRVLTLVTSRRVQALEVTAWEDVDQRVRGELERVPVEARLRGDARDVA